MPVIIILIIIVVIMSIKCVKVIQQSTVGIIMRLGKFHKKADTGVHFLVPFIATLLAIFVYKEEININRAITLCIIISASIIYSISIFKNSHTNK